MPGFPNITEAYAQTFAAKQLTPEVWVSSHAGHFGLHENINPAMRTSKRFIDPEGYRAKIERYKTLSINCCANGRVSWQ
jgi:hypothetical protein